MGTWSSGGIERQLLSAMAAAVQRGSAMAMLVGYTRTTQVVKAGSGRDEAAGEWEEYGGGREVKAAAAWW